VQVHQLDVFTTPRRKYLVGMHLICDQLILSKFVYWIKDSSNSAQLLGVEDQICEMLGLMVLKIYIHLWYTHYFFNKLSDLSVFIDFDANIQRLVISQFYEVLLVCHAFLFLFCLKHALHFVRKSMHNYVK
jgi:hypothetical protein